MFERLPFKYHRTVREDDEHLNVFPNFTHGK